MDPILLGHVQPSQKKQDRTSPYYTAKTEFVQSLAYGGADFSQATVSMRSGGQGIPVSVRPVVDGYGENTLVWEPDLSLGTPPAGDTAYDVTVSQVKVDGAWRDFSYQVIVFDPGSIAGRAAACSGGC